MNPVQEAIKADDAASLTTLLRQFAMFPLDEITQLALAMGVCFHNSASCLDALLLHGWLSANMSIPFSDSQLLSYAIFGGSAGVEIISVLLKHDADVNHADEDGRTPLWVALAHSRADLIPLLLTYGANINLDKTLLAACCNNFECTRLLVDAGAYLIKSYTGFVNCDPEAVEYVLRIVPDRIARCRAAVDATCLCLMRVSYFVDKPVTKKIAGLLWASRRREEWD